MKASEIKTGLRIYNRGDRVNLPHWGIVTKIIKSERFSDSIEITPETEIENASHKFSRKPYSVYPSCISEIDKGNGFTRIVTEKAYKTRREQQIKEMEKSLTQKTIKRKLIK